VQWVIARWERLGGTHPDGPDIASQGLQVGRISRFYEANGQHQGAFAKIKKLAGVPKI
jgi:hypothetical protein